MCILFFKEKEESYENKRENRPYQRNNFDYRQPRTPKVSNNNYIDHNRDRGYDYNRKPQFGKNMLIPQEE